MEQQNNRICGSCVASFHLPGLFEFLDFYKVFLPLFYSHREYFYDHVRIASLYGAPDDCIWGGGRFGFGNENPRTVVNFVHQYGISARLTFSNSLIREDHLKDAKCNKLCSIFEEYNTPQNGVIVHSDLLLDYLKSKFPGLYYISSTTKVLNDFESFKQELDREEFQFVVPDFRLNNKIEKLKSLTETEKNKTEFLCNECCYIGCKDRKQCYENVSRRILGEETNEFQCTAPNGGEGYQFSKAKLNPSFIGTKEILETYLPLGFSNFKIEGRGLGTAMILEFLLYYLTKPEYRLNVRECIYLDSMLDLF